MWGHGKNKCRERRSSRRQCLRPAAAAKLARGERHYQGDGRAGQRRRDPQRERHVAEREQPSQQHGGWST